MCNCGVIILNVAEQLIWKQLHVNKLRIIKLLEILIVSSRISSRYHPGNINDITSISSKATHTHLHTYTHTPTHQHTYTYTPTHTNTHTPIHPLTPTNIYMLVEYVQHLSQGIQLGSIFYEITRASQATVLISAHIRLT